MWGWRGEGTEEPIREKLVAILGKRGYSRSPIGTRGTAHLGVVADGAGGVVVCGTGFAGAGHEVASELSGALGVVGRYVEVDLRDTEVLANRRNIAKDGALGAIEDLDKLATETCADWHGGKKFRSESCDHLVAFLLDLDDGMPDGAAMLSFLMPRRGRAEALIEEVEKGASWSKTIVGGRDAVRLASDAGLRISVLDPEELAVFEAGVRKG